MSVKRVDLLSQFMTIVHQRGESASYTPKKLRTEMVAGTFAGVDSTAATIRTIFYSLMNSPRSMKKVQAEIDAAFANGTLSHPVQYNKVIKFPYLQAVIKEVARMFPAW
ncbi:cytochrome P450 [Dothidotthia symphoricarpi CBS 119687]|uniref:Cytochrome P450 n=1 Tax=Dothidotthia symphoricarpi CBS 119687 TaxID=1392245 RepID=A0A6A6A681_9PLEO|nr:cytochrome P450 [Dothidotthia symphoricarpi CBS 119687]KAF2127340.1 cytochrome P450 [Dothidotthia symphoricarpi CBS 119687]